MIRIQTDGDGEGNSIALFHDKAYYRSEKGITHNEAEYNGIILALENLPAGSEAVIQTDSRLVVGQLAEGWKVNHPHLLSKIRQINMLVAKKRLEVKFEWIPREENRADVALRRHLGRYRAD